MTDEKYTVCYGDHEALLVRLSEHTHRRPVIFLAGSALTKSESGISPEPKSDNKKPHVFCDGGVYDTAGVIRLIEKELSECGGVPANCDAKGKSESLEASYQQSFHSLLLHCGPDAAREILCEAVIKAYGDQDSDNCERNGRKNNSLLLRRTHFDDSRYREFEDDLSQWRIPQGATALGEIIAEFPEDFGTYLLTTNFDPLLAISIRRARGRVVQTVMYSDGNPALTLVNGCHMVHLHGYWYRDALHTPEQLRSERHNLTEFLKFLIRKYTIVVVGYGGWDDQFLDAITYVVKEQNEEPDILWTFYSVKQANPEKLKIPLDNSEAYHYKKRIEDKLRPGIGRGRVLLYEGINCNTLFPELLKKLRENNAKEVVNHLRQRTSENAANSLELEVKNISEKAANGCWLLVSSHSARDLIKLEELKPDNTESASWDDFHGKIHPLPDMQDQEERDRGSLFPNDKPIFDSKQSSIFKRFPSNENQSDKTYPYRWRYEGESKAIVLEVAEGYEIWIREAFAGSVH